MTKLATADHIDTIIRVLSKDSWFADLMWEHQRHDTDIDEVHMPDEVRHLPGGMTMIRVAPKEWVPTERLMWAGRAAWDADPLTARYRAPFKASAFKRRSKTKIDGAVRRVFSMEGANLVVHTFEQGDMIVRIEFVRSQDNRPGEVLHTVHADEIPAPAPATVAKPAAGYDVITAEELERLIIRAGSTALLAESRHATLDAYQADMGAIDLDAVIEQVLPYSAMVEADLARVDFDGENTTAKFQATGIAGFNRINDMTFYGVMAGGDWEHPVVFILYAYKGELRGYVPDKGNVYNRKTMQAYGNDDQEPPEMKPWNVSLLGSDIQRHFGAW